MKTAEIENILQRFEPRLADYGFIIQAFVEFYVYVLERPEEGVCKSLQDKLLVEALVEHDGVVVHELESNKHFTGEVLTLLGADVQNRIGYLVDVQQGQHSVILNHCLIDVLAKHH